MTGSDGPTPLTAAQKSALEKAACSGAELRCPVCGVPLDQRPVPPRSDVAYVRERVWLVCPSCHRTAVIDRRRQT